MGLPIIHILWPEDSCDMIVAKSGETLVINIAVQSATEPIVTWFNQGKKLDQSKGFNSGKICSGRYYASFLHVPDNWNSVDVYAQNRDGSKSINIPIKVFKVRSKAKNIRSRKSETFRPRDLAMTLPRRMIRSDSLNYTSHDLNSTVDSTTCYTNIPLAGTLSRYRESASYLGEDLDDVFEDNFNISSVENLRKKTKSRRKIFNSAPKLHRTMSSLVRTDRNSMLFNSSDVRPRSCVFVTPTIRRHVKSIADFRAPRQSNVQEDISCQVLPVGPLAISEFSSEENFATIPKSPIIMYEREKVSQISDKTKEDSLNESFLNNNRFNDTAKVINNGKPIIKQKTETRKSNNLMKRFSNIFKSFRSKKEIKINKKVEDREQVPVKKRYSMPATEENQTLTDLDDAAVKKFFRQNSLFSDNSECISKRGTSEIDIYHTSLSNDSESERRELDYLDVNKVEENKIFNNTQSALTSREESLVNCEQTKNLTQPLKSNKCKGILLKTGEDEKKETEKERDDENIENIKSDDEDTDEWNSDFVTVTEVMVDISPQKLNIISEDYSQTVVKDSYKPKTLRKFSESENEREMENTQDMFTYFSSNFLEVHFMWAAHQAHHSSEDYNFTTALRQSCLQQFHAWLFFAPIALFVPPQVYVVHHYFNLLWQFWLHTEIIGDLGFLESVLNTPKHHRVHHGRNKYCVDKNYGGILIIWDHAFGKIITVF
ncbi:DgyrCDS11144 [Dimorphilus gyrociliatus]|uniref:DgyrCDS11144 n=1 Tax=Dimorphilus gyrociliatus TaxID=2664684 RepID=A0A7I8W3H6_9ANNE|nr:DgyrCDS11144 [Dimorphilus gyrociliatus]